MLISNAFLLIFAIAFMACVLATPLVTRLAVWAGAIDHPDHFRRIHKGATPRLGGVGLAFGATLAIVVGVKGGYLDDWPELSAWWPRQWAVLVASLVVLLIGVVDDTRAMGPRMKLLGQSLAVLVLYVGGIRIQAIDILGLGIDLGHPLLSLTIAGQSLSVAPASLLITLFWFLGCMNIWNLIDGMDGLASGVGLLVSGTLTLVAIHHQNVGVAILAAALAGSLAGFLLYNWHPACIFLGDSGSLLIGLLIGVIGVEGSLKGPSAISILFPILAMGLPITDTAMAIFRRWVRNLPLSSADRRHVHHLLIGFGLDPRQAALFLYCFSGFLCGVVLLGVALRNEILALILGLSGCLAFLLILTSRRDELASLRADLQTRLARGRQERFAAKLTWEAIQRIELCEQMSTILDILDSTTRKLGCGLTRMSCERQGEAVLEWSSLQGAGPEGSASLSGPSASFRLTSGEDLLLRVSLTQAPGPSLEADIAFRFLQRLSLATAERLERLLAGDRRPDAEVSAVERPGDPVSSRSTPPEGGSTHQGPPVLVLSPHPPTWASLNWVRHVFGWETRPASPHPSLGEK